MVYENFLGPFRRDETVSSLVAEPLDGATGHGTSSLCGRMSTAGAAGRLDRSRGPVKQKRIGVGGVTTSSARDVLTARCGCRATLPASTRFERFGVLGLDFEHE